MRISQISRILFTFFFTPHIFLQVSQKFAPFAQFALKTIRKIRIFKFHFGVVVLKRGGKKLHIVNLFFNFVAIPGWGCGGGPRKDILEAFCVILIQEIANFNK